MNATQLGPGIWLHDPLPWWLSFYDGRALIGSFHVGKFQQILVAMTAAGVTLADAKESA